MFLIAFPLLLIPLVLYNMAVFLLDLPLSTELYAIPLPSGARFPVSVGDGLVVLALLLLYLEVLKAARFASKAGMDHLLAFIIFVGMVCEFALVPKVQTTAFLFLTVIALVDLLVGISVGIRARRRGIVLEDEHDAP
jgi:hypothetical protein